MDQKLLQTFNMCADLELLNRDIWCHLITFAIGTSVIIRSTSNDENEHGLMKITQICYVTYSDTDLGFLQDDAIGSILQYIACLSEETLSASPLVHVLVIGQGVSQLWVQV